MSLHLLGLSGARWDPECAAKQILNPSLILWQRRAMAGLWGICLCCSYLSHCIPSLPGLWAQPTLTQVAMFCLGVMGIEPGAEVLLGGVGGGAAPAGWVTPPGCPLGAE